MTKRNKKLKTTFKIPVYFDKVKEGPKLAMLDHFRVLSGLTTGEGKPISMPNFIKYLAVEFCLMIDATEREKLENEKKEAEKSTPEKTLEEFAEEALPEGYTARQLTDEEMPEDDSEEI